MSGPIVVGYDGSEGARAALDEAVGLAAALGSELVVGFGFGTSALGGEVQDLARAVRELGEQRLAEARAVADAAGVPCSAELVDDRPAEGLVRLAEARGARMIVTGSHGERPLRGVMVGSTPYRLMHLSEVPVLVVRASHA
jgi:nucleotide-binding universal stress UspA family protein